MVVRFVEAALRNGSAVGIYVEVDEFGETWLTPEQIALCEDTCQLLEDFIPNRLRHKQNHPKYSKRTSAAPPDAARVAKHRQQPLRAQSNPDVAERTTAKAEAQSLRLRTTAKKAGAA